jgi:hypothetical protein
LFLRVVKVFGFQKAQETQAVPQSFPLAGGKSGWRACSTLRHPL